MHEEEWIVMVGCGQILKDVESGWLDNGTLRANYPVGFWSAYKVNEMLCGLKNRSHEIRYDDPNDRIMCERCLRKEGFLW
jgi:hypothetical protein